MTTDGKATGCCSIRPAEADAALGDRDARFLAQALAVPRAADDIVAALRARLTRIPGGIFEMGARKSTFPADQDSPRRKVKLRPYRLAAHSVTTADYAHFVAATDYRTVAEQDGWGFVFHLMLKAPDDWPISPPGLPWWRKVDGACWAAPEGAGSDMAGRQTHPATHIAWFDALAYCQWAGLRLPTEAEWEHAARGGLARRKFPWGDALMPGGAHAMNTFQGRFPMHNNAEDGWLGTAPVDAYRPNGYGMHNMTGNVWEWVHDYFGPRPAIGTLPQDNPTGPATGQRRIQRGGSYLCHVSYCDRYHVHSRTPNDPDSSAGHVGFRVAAAD